MFFFSSLDVSSPRLYAVVAVSTMCVCVSEEVDGSDRVKHWALFFFASLSDQGRRFGKSAARRQWCVFARRDRFGGGQPASQVRFAAAADAATAAASCALNTMVHVLFKFVVNHCRHTKKASPRAIVFWAGAILRHGSFVMLPRATRSDPLV